MINRILLIGLLLIPQASPLQNYDYFISLQKKTTPIISVNWELRLYRQKNNFFLKSINYQSKNFTISIPAELYLKTVKKLNDNKVWLPKKSKSEEQFSSDFFQIIIYKNKIQNNFLFSVNNHNNEIKCAKTIMQLADYLIMQKDL